jgi:hypothetical protein
LTCIAAMRLYAIDIAVGVAMRAVELVGARELCWWCSALVAWRGDENGKAIRAVL